MNPNQWVWSLDSTGTATRISKLKAAATKVMDKVDEIVDEVGELTEKKKTTDKMTDFVVVDLVRRCRR